METGKNDALFIAARERLRAGRYAAAVLARLQQRYYISFAEDENHGSAIFENDARDGPGLLF